MMNEEEILIAKLRAKGVSEEAIKQIIEFYKDLCNVSFPCSALRVNLREKKK